VKIDEAALAATLLRLAHELEAKAPEGMAFSLFLYEPRHGGLVGQISRDRDLTRQAVEHWIALTFSSPEARA
jgi:hypothetical protein